MPARPTAVQRAHPHVSAAWVKTPTSTEAIISTVSIDVLGAPVKSALKAGGWTPSPYATSATPDVFDWLRPARARANAPARAGGGAT